MAVKFKLYKNKFKFRYIKGFRVCKIILRCSLSNIFVSVIDKFGRLIICHTSGSSGVAGSKRRKTAPYAIEKIVSSIYPHFVTHKIKMVDLILKNKIRSPAYFLGRELTRHGIFVSSVKQRKSLAHNGCRPRKLRRN